MVTYSRKARIALDTLAEQEQKTVEAAALRLDRPIDELSESPSIHKLEAPGNIYIEQADNSLCVIFDHTPEGTRILDIVRRERLDQFHRSLVAEIGA